MNTRLKQIKRKVQGDRDTFVLNHRILNTAIALMMLIFCSFLFIYLFVDTPIELLSFIFGSALFYIGYYYYSRFMASYHPRLYWFFIIITIAFGITSWFLTDAWRGATPIVSMMALVIFLSISKRQDNFRVTLVIVSFLTILFACNKYINPWVIPYANAEAYFWDVSITTIASCIVIALIVDSLQSSYYEEKIKVEQQNIKLKEALEQLKTTQKELVQAEKMAGLGTMAAGIAHEINNPINFVYIGAQALEEQLQDLELEMKAQIEVAYRANNLTPKYTPLESQEDIFMIAQNMKTGAQRVAHLVSLLSQLSNYREQKKSTSNIKEIIEESIFKLEHPNKDALVLKSASNHTVKMLCHPSQLLQAFIHIFTNALDALPEKGGKAEVFITSIAKEAVIYIQDNGYGIPESVQKSIFDPFFTTKDVGEGMGLGLSLAYDIILYHQGRITVSSQEGKGTTVTVFLPIEEVS